MAALILFAHGSRDPQWSAPFERMLAKVRELAPAHEAMLAYLQFLTPDLDGAIEALASRRHCDIRVAPIFLGTGGHLSRELPNLVERARAAHPHLRIELLRPPGEDERVIAAIARYAVEGTREA